MVFLFLVVSVIFLDDDKSVSVGLTDKQKEYVLKIWDRVRQGKTTSDDVAVLSRMEKYDDLGFISLLSNYHDMMSLGSDLDLQTKLENMQKTMLLRLKRADIGDKRKFKAAQSADIGQKMSIRTINALGKMSHEEYKRLYGGGGTHVDYGDENDA